MNKSKRVKALVPGETTRLLSLWHAGDQAAFDRVLPIVYEELRRLASSYMRSERPDHLLQTTALVHEAYLRIVDHPETSGETQYLSKLARQSQAALGLQRELAEAYLKVGHLQGNPYEPNLGDTQGAAESYAKALAISAGLARADGKDAQAQRYLGRSYQSLGEVLPLVDKAVDGVADMRKASEIFEMLVSRMPQDHELRVQLADCYQSLGDLQGHSGLQNLGDRVGALDSYRKAVAVFDAMATENPSDQKARGGAAVMGSESVICSRDRAIGMPRLQAIAARCSERNH